jgi:hypothetical protein
VVSWESSLLWVCGEVGRRWVHRWFDCTPLWSGLARVPWVLVGCAALVHRAEKSHT